MIVTSDVPGAVQVNVACGVEAPDKLPLVALQLYERGAGTPSKSLATTLSAIVLPTGAERGEALSVSIVGQTLTVPPMITLPLFFCFMQRSATGTTTVVLAATLKFAEPAHVILPSVDVAVRVMVYPGPGGSPPTWAAIAGLLLTPIEPVNEKLFGPLIV